MSSGLMSNCFSPAPAWAISTATARRIDAFGRLDARLSEEVAIFQGPLHRLLEAFLGGFETAGSQFY